MPTHSARNEKLPNSAHTAEPWYIHQIAPDFDLEDVWSVPVRGTSADFKKFVVTYFQSPPTLNGISRLLFALRWQLGKWFGWDKDMEKPIQNSLKSRIPVELQKTVSQFDIAGKKFKPLYLLDNEFAEEVSNETMHGILHIGFVTDPTSGSRIQLAILVKPNGALGRFYMALIKPFRHLFIYPSLMNSVQRTWASAQSMQGEPV